MLKPEDFLQQGDGLLVVDVQQDFCPGGALPIPDGDKVVPVINVWVEAFSNQKLPIYYSCDWHPEGHPSFKCNGGEWPEHCVQNTAGAAFHTDLQIAPKSAMISKGVRFDQDQLSAFHETGFAEKLCLDRVKRLLVTGLALDVCVLATVLDGIRAGFDVWVLVEGCRPVTEEGGRNALDAMLKAGAHFIEG